MAPHKRIAPLRLNFVIVGGSLGGLAAAYALSTAGHYVHVIETKEQKERKGCYGEVEIHCIVSQS